MLRKLFKHNIAERHSFRYLFYLPALILYDRKETLKTAKQHEFMTLLCSSNQIQLEKQVWKF